MFERKHRGSVLTIHMADASLRRLRQKAHRRDTFRRIVEAIVGGVVLAFGMIAAAVFFMGV